LKWGAPRATLVSAHAQRSLKRMKLGLILWLWLPLLALADGKIFPSTAYPETIRIPEQEVLIHWANGVERLVIETRFDAKGTNFAWVIPLPSRPKITAATPGVFPTLRSYFAPTIRRDEEHTYFFVYWLIAVTGILFFLRSNDPLSVAEWLGLGLFTWINVIACGEGAGCLTAVAIAISRVPTTPRGVNIFHGLTLSLFVVSAVLVITNSVQNLPGLACLFSVALGLGILCISDSTGSAHLGPSLLILVLVLEFLLGSLPALSKRRFGQWVGPATVLNRAEAVVEETTVIETKDVSAVTGWFRTNGFALRPADEPILDDYVRDGWVLVASKIRAHRTNDGQQVVHGLSLEFPTAAPILPLRFGAETDGSVRVTLYVFGEQRAAVDGFRMGHCEQPAFSEPTPRPIPRRWRLDIQHPLLRQWLLGSDTATKLDATLLPTQMRQDPKIRWEPFTSHRTSLDTGNVFTTRAKNAAAYVLSIGVFIGFVAFWTVFSGPSAHARLVLWSFAMFGLSWIVENKVSHGKPSVDAHAIWFGSVPRFRVESLIEEAVGHNPQDVTPKADDLRAAIQRVQAAQPRYTNDLQGGLLREEDSPGNYLLRDSTNGVETFFFDIDGGKFQLGSQQKRRTGSR
jgi:hypothetical protein